MVREQKDHRAAGRKGGFKSLGSNLPANAYRGKVEKIKAGLIHNAKVKRAYSRTLKREETSGFLPPSLDSFNVPNTKEKLETADLETLHPSRSRALAAPPTTDTHQPRRSAATTASRRRPPIVTKEEKAAAAAKREHEKEQAQREREKKIKRRERMKKNFRKMTKRGQPVMKPRLEHLLSKVKKAMKQD